MISTDREAAAAILEDDEELVDGLLKEFSIVCEGESEGYKTFDTDDERDVDIMNDVIEWPEWDLYESVERQLHPPRPRGYKDKLKHTINLNKSKNLYKLVTVIPAAGYKSTSKNFKRSAMDPKDERKRKSRPKERPINKQISSNCEERVDAHGLFIIQRMIHNQLLKRVNNLLETELNCLTFHGTCNSSYPMSLDTSKVPSQLPRECMIKIYMNYPGQTATNETMQLWGEREWTNLRRAWGIIPCPQPIYRKHHIFVSSLVGVDRKLAPRLRDIKFTREEYAMAYHEIVESMRALYAEANVIHGNLSEFTIRWHNRKCYFVDFEESLQPHEANAFEALLMDCTNISKFFRIANVPDMFTTDGLFRHITGCSYKDKLGFEQLVKSSQSRKMN